jgi:ABC-type multidrug transport system ATPase subunit
LSGGQRRRLSIAISLIGDPLVWLLDEPSTGLSPEARRTVWNIITEQKKFGRAMIISTHSMEEADTLGDRIAIMGNGRMKCTGTQAHLKNKFGTGFKLTVTGGNDFTPEQLQQLETYVVSLCPSAEAHHASGTSGNTAIFRFPDYEPALVLSVFARLSEEAKKGSLRHLGVQDVGIGQSSLDEVFVEVVGESNDEEVDGGAQPLVPAGV